MGGVRGKPQDEISYRPQNKQLELIRAVGLGEWWTNNGKITNPKARLIGYGGAAYGGKSYGMLGLAYLCAYAFPGCQISYFRRKYTEMEGPGAVMHDAAELFTGVASRHDEGKHYHFKKTNSDFYFRHCENEGDVYNYQSQQIDVLLVDEATHFTWFILDYLLTRNRVSGPCGIVEPFAVLSSNPGNIGHADYMQLFDLEKEVVGVEGTKEHSQVKHVKNPNGKYVDVYFIPAFIKDNKIGVLRDPEYEKRLREADPDLASALAEGNWSVFKGRAFRQWDKERHVVKDYPMKSYFPRWRAVDWGYDKPFCCHWFAMDIDIGRIIVYREIYMAGLTDQQQARLILANSPKEEHVSMTWADPSMWIKHNYQGMLSSSAEEYRNEGVPLVQADNDRISGKRKYDRYLADLPDGKPGIVYIEDNCPNAIRTIPKLARSEANPEDVDDRQEDHAYDTDRYGLSNVDLFAHRRKPNPNEEQMNKNPWDDLGGII